jgi:hypothetical protein
LAVCFWFFSLFQENDTIQGDIMIKIDSLYREDQFYFSFTYNTAAKNQQDYHRINFQQDSLQAFEDMP